MQYIKTNIFPSLPLPFPSQLPYFTYKKGF